MPTPKTEPEGLASRMNKTRVERKMTQQQLADRLHVKQAMVSMIEAGESVPGDELSTRIKAWIASGAGPRSKSARGPYATKKRSTIPR